MGYISAIVFFRFPIFRSIFLVLHALTLLTSFLTQIWIFVWWKLEIGERKLTRYYRHIDLQENFNLNWYWKEYRSIDFWGVFHFKKFRWYFLCFNKVYLKFIKSWIYWSRNSEIYVLSASKLRSVNFLLERRIILERSLY